MATRAGVMNRARNLRLRPLRESRKPDDSMRAPTVGEPAFLRAIGARAFANVGKTNANAKAATTAPKALESCRGLRWAVTALELVRQRARWAAQSNGCFAEEIVCQVQGSGGPARAAAQAHVVHQQDDQGQSGKYNRFRVAAKRSAGSPCDSQ